MNDFALPPSCSPSFSLVITPVSALNVNGCSQGASKHVQSAKQANVYSLSALSLTGDMNAPDKQTIVKGTISPYKPAENMITRRRSIPSSVSCGTMHSTFPLDLRPIDHPIFKDLTRPKSSPTSSVLVETPMGQSSQYCSASTFSTAGSISAERQGRPKGSHQLLSRYHTTPVTFEEITEIDEELYAKQNPKDDEEDQHDGPTLRRTASIGSPYSSAGYNKKRNSFEIKNAKTRSHSAGAVLFPTSSSSQRTGPSSFIGYRNKQRSQESLCLQGASTLPTIPEELRLQNQQQQSPAAEQQCASEEIKQGTPMQRSRSLDASVEREDTSSR